MNLDEICRKYVCLSRSNPHNSLLLAVQSCSIPSHLGKKSYTTHSQPLYVAPISNDDDWGISSQMASFCSFYPPVLPHWRLLQPWRRTGGLHQHLRLLRQQPRQGGTELAGRRAVLALEELGPGQNAARGTALAAA